MIINSNVVVSLLVAFCTFFIAKVLFPTMPLFGLFAISAVVTSLVYFIFIDREQEGETSEVEQEFFTEGFPDASDEQAPAPTENEKSKPARKSRKKKEEQ